MNADKFTVQILDDGTLKITTDRVSAANHVNADNFIRELFRKAGGAVEIQHRHGKKIHVHAGADMAAVELEAGGHEH
jgi:hypothetical protein